MKVLLTTNNHLGDVVIMTAVIENLKLAMPSNEFALDANEKYLEVFDGNPNISRFARNEADCCFECVYAPFSQRSANGGNCIEAFTKNAFSYFGINAQIVQRTAKFYFNIEQNQFGDYCIINANCQKCSETKGYPFYQEIVDACPNMQFVQIGGNEERDITTNLKNVVDLRGKTSVRQLVSLVANAKYIVSPPSAVVHIASAFPNVKAIVLSGAREPARLTAYPNTTHIVANCIDGYNAAFGCMKFFMRKIDSRTCERCVALNGRSYPACMCLIKPCEVAELIK